MMLVYQGTVKIIGKKKNDVLVIPVFTDNIHALDEKHINEMEERLWKQGFVLLIDNRDDNNYIQQLYVNTEKFKEIEVSLSRVEKYE